MTRLWIEKRLREIGKKKIELGRAIGLPPSRISDIIHGNRRIHSHEIPQLSIFLELDMGMILNFIHLENNEEGAIEHTPTEQIVVAGSLKLLNCYYSLWSRREHYTITLPIQASFTGIPKFALEESRSPNLPKKLHICVKEADLQSPPKPGLIKITDSTNRDRHSAPKEFLNAVTPHKGDQKNSTAVVFIIGKYQQF